MKRLISFLVFLLIPATAMAVTISPVIGTHWEFVVLVGNVGVMTQILTSVRDMTDPAINDSYRTLVMIVAVVGFLGVTISTMRGKVESAGKYVVIILFVTYALFSLKVDMAITDSVGIETQTVNQVPAAVGFPAIIIQTVGNYLTTSVETFFPVGFDPNLTLSQGIGVNISSLAMESISNSRIEDPQLRSNVLNFFKDCGMVALAKGTLNPSVIVDSANLWADISAVANYPNVYTYYYNGAINTFGSCNDSAIDITARIAAYSDNDFATSAVAGLPSVAGVPGVEAFATAGFNAALNLHSAGGLGNAKDAALQNGVIELFRHSYDAAAAASGSSEMTLAMNTEQAKAAQKTGWYTTAALFREAVPNMYALMTAFMVALAPIVLAGSLIPKVGAKLFNGWAQVLIWLALWNPAFAIANFILTTRERDGLVRLFNNSGAGGYSLGNDVALSQAASDFVMQGGVLMALIPTVLWGLVKGGSVAMTSAMERSSGGSNAASAATATASDSFSHGAKSFNNISANQHNLASSYQYGSNGVSSMTTRGTKSGFNTQMEQDYRNGVGSTATTNSRLLKSLSGQISRAEEERASIANIHESSMSGGVSLLSNEVKSQSTKFMGQTNAQESKGVKETLDFASSYALAYHTMKENGVDQKEMVKRLDSMALVAGKKEGSANLRKNLPLGYEAGEIKTSEDAQKFALRYALDERSGFGLTSSNDKAYGQTYIDSFENSNQENQQGVVQAGNMFQEGKSAQIALLTTDRRIDDLKLSKELAKSEQVIEGLDRGGAEEVLSKGNNGLNPISISIPNEGDFSKINPPSADRIKGEVASRKESTNDGVNGSFAKVVADGATLPTGATKEEILGPNGALEKGKIKKQDIQSHTDSSSAQTKDAAVANAVKTKEAQLDGIYGMKAGENSLANDQNFFGSIHKGLALEHGASMVFGDSVLGKVASGLVGFLGGAIIKETENGGTMIMGLSKNPEAEMRFQEQYGNIAKPVMHGNEALAVPVSVMREVSADGKTGENNLMYLTSSARMNEQGEYVNKQGDVVETAAEAASDYHFAKANNDGTLSNFASANDWVEKGGGKAAIDKLTHADFGDYQTGINPDDDQIATVTVSDDGGALAFTYTENGVTKRHTFTPHGTDHPGDITDQPTVSLVKRHLLQGNGETQQMKQNPEDYEQIKQDVANQKELNNAAREERLAKANSKPQEESPGFAGLVNKIFGKGPGL